MFADWGSYHELKSPDLPKSELFKEHDQTGSSSHPYKSITRRIYKRLTI